MKNNKKLIIGIIILVLIIFALLIGFYLMKTNKTIKGVIECTVLDQSDIGVSNITIRLAKQDGTIIGDVKSGADGKIMYYDVTPGNYTLSQIDTKDGYNKNEELVNVTVNSNETSTIDFKIERTIGMLEITKEDDSNNPINNVTFNIYDEEGYLITSIITNEHGKANITLQNGTYYLKEADVEEGYIKDDTMYRVVVDDENKTFFKTVTNIRYKGTLLITAYDTEGNTVKDVEFNIYDTNGNVAYTIKTNDIGRAGVANIPYGTYYYQQSQVPDGFKKDEEKHEFVIVEHNQVINKNIVIEKN